MLKCRKVLTESSAKAVSGGQLLDGAGTVLLDIVPYGDKAPRSALGTNTTPLAQPHCFNTPDGTTVVLFANTKGGTAYTRKESEWVIWTAEDAAQTGQPPEATPVGASMYKFGTIKTRTSDAIPEFFDASGTKVMTPKDWRAEGRNAVVLQSADGTTPMAKVKEMKGHHNSRYGKLKNTRLMSPSQREWTRSSESSARAVPQVQCPRRLVRSRINGEVARRSGGLRC